MFLAEQASGAKFEQLTEFNRCKIVAFERLELLEQICRVKCPSKSLKTHMLMVVRYE